MSDVESKPLLALDLVWFCGRVAEIAARVADENQAKRLVLLEHATRVAGSSGEAMTIARELIAFCEEHGIIAPLKTANGLGAGDSIGLSDMQLKVLGAIARGRPNKQIAYELAISEATVKVHVKAVFQKLRVRNRTLAAIWATTHGIGLDDHVQPEGAHYGGETTARPH